MEAGSSTSSTSNTLTFGTPIIPTIPHMFPPAGASGTSAALLEALRAQGSGRHVFLQPPAVLPTASLQLVKDTLEGFAGSVSDLQLEQLRAANKKKRKREAGDADDKIEVLKIRKVHVDGFETGQVWQQARRIIDSALEFSERAVEALGERNEILKDEETTSVNGDVRVSDGDDEQQQQQQQQQQQDLVDDFEDFGSVGDEGDEDLLDDDDLEDVKINGTSLEASDGEYDNEPAEEYAEDPNGLNDGFFSIDEFNRVSQWFEDQDARGDPNTDRHSDDEDIDWDADISAMGSKRKPPKTSRNAKQADNEAALPDAMDMDMGHDQENDDDDDDDEAGPTFGDMDLNAPEGASDDEADDDDDSDDAADEPEFNANGIYYDDFFAPPAKKPSRDGKRQKKSVSFGPSQVPDDAEIARAMADVHHNLYDDLSEQEDSEGGALSDASATDPRSRQSNHQRRQAKIAEEIRKLEAELVAKRAWTLSGEAKAADRPVDSLLEQELDFEHMGKPVPVITTEVTEDIEAMIKRRIVAQDFDEVIRRRPDASSLLSNPDGARRRGLVPIEDAQSAKGLAEIYEEAHVKATNPDAYASASEEKIRQDEKEVERMWRHVCGKLDALSSWHYRPKNVEPAVSVVAHVAAVSMEDAQPATAQGIVAAAESVLAPQEVYRAGAAETGAEPARGEVHLAKSGLPVARAEMTREEKLRRRRREKERKSKAGVGFASGSAQSAKRKEEGVKENKGETLAQLKKGGVAVINKKGELVGVDGKKSKVPKGPTGSGFKL